MLNNLTVPPIYIYMGNNKKNLTERINHGLSLTNLTHCISPSEYCDNYYNNNSFNEINLQLHASSKVSNPYSFSIKSNTKFSGVVQSLLPTTDTKFSEVYVNNIDYSKSIIVTIPKGVNVIMVVSVCSNVSSPTSRTFYSLSTGTYPNNKYWAEVNVGESKLRYIGVTPEKSYTVTADISSNSSKGFQGGSTIYYSAEINTQTPDVEDY